ncbi:MAG: 50S ribosomal protein L21, partial [Akkermansiaceae bacterium]
MHFLVEPDPWSKQHRVEKGEVIRFEKLKAEAGTTVDFDKVMMVADGADVKIGAPYVEGGKVSAEVVD